jgi:hypothetical protein
MIAPELAAFLEEGLAIHLGTRDEQLAPNGTHVVGVKVDDDGSQLVVYVAKTSATHVLRDLRSNRQAAVVFARPTDDRACQVKGIFVSARPARDDERAFIIAQWDLFLDKLAAIGIPRGFAAGWDTWPAMAIRIQATTLFEQTPGPAAGTPLV